MWQDLLFLCTYCGETKKANICSKVMKSAYIAPKYQKNFLKKYEKVYCNL